MRVLRYVLMLAAAVVLPAAAQSPRPMTLGEAINRGWTSGVNATLARLAAKGADARVGEAKAALLPDISASGTVQRQTVNLSEFGISIPGFPAVTDPFTLFRGRAQFSQLLYDAATLERLRIARDTAEVAGLDARHVGELSAALAGAAWLQLASADATITAREDDSVTAFALRSIAQSRVDAGTAPRIDLTRSETEAAATRTALAVARNARDRAALMLARAVGLPPATPLTATGDLSLGIDSLPADPDSAAAMAERRRSDLAAERQRLTILREGLTAIKRERLPSAVASGFVQTSGVKTDSLYRTWNIGVGITLPIFDGFRRARREDEQQVRIDAEQVRLQDLTDQVDADARQAVLDLASARDQVNLATERLGLADTVLSEAQQRFSAGVTGSVETTNAQADVAQARDALIQARLAVGVAQVSAAKALGLLDQVH